MAEITEAERYLVEQIRKGNADGWQQLVKRYQGRLLAFARSRLARKSEAEDLVQDTFVTFLQAIKSFRDEYSLETYLFTILRRKIIDLLRGRQLRACFLQDVLSGGSAEPEATFDVSSDQPSPSWYARRDEHASQARRLLVEALAALLARLKEAENFRDLKIVEMCFYGQIRNKDVAKVAGIDEKHVALIKHRMLKEVREHVAREASRIGLSVGELETPAWENSDTAGSLLTEVWEDQRLTCPKRSTVGRFLLGTLDPPWSDYVEFHVNRLGCHFCRANVEDLQKQTAEDAQRVQERVFQSTIGFFRPS